MAGKVTDLSGAVFGETIAKGVTLVDFWATWCPPCRMQGPIVEKLADTYAGKVVIAKVNVDVEGELAVKYGVASIPTLILFKDGKEEKRFVGLRQGTELALAFDALL